MRDKSMNFAGIVSAIILVLFYIIDNFIMTASTNGIYIGYFFKIITFIVSIFLCNKIINENIKPKQNKILIKRKHISMFIYLGIFAGFLEIAYKYYISIYKSEIYTDLFFDTFIDLINENTLMIFLFDTTYIIVALVFICKIIYPVLENYIPAYISIIITAIAGTGFLFNTKETVLIGFIILCLILINVYTSENIMGIVAVPIFYNLVHLIVYDTIEFYEIFGIWEYTQEIITILFLLSGYIYFNCLTTLDENDDIKRFKREKKQNLYNLTYILNSFLIVYLILYLFFLLLL